MSRTHRGFNRILILIFSLIFLAAGAAVLLSGLWPEAARIWRRSTEQLWQWAGEAFRATTFNAGDWRSNWVWIAILAAIVLAVIVLLWWVFSQGGGHTSLLLKQRAQGATGEGQLEVRQDLAAESLKESLEDDPRILASSVSAWDLGRKAKAARAGSQVNALKVSVQSRKGASPREIAEVVETSIRGLDRVIGELGPVPVLISINAGARTGWSHQHRVN